jgi:hypothetical protein
MAPLDDLQEVPRLLDGPAYAVRILDVLHDEHPPAIRQHDGVHVL